MKPIDIETNIQMTRTKLQKRVDAGIDPDSLDPSTKRRLMESYKFFEENVDKEVPLLDIGAREGWFLKFLKKRGFKDISAIDISPDAVKIMKSNGWNVTCMDAQELTIENLFGTITMIHTLEHCADPRSVVNNIYDALTKGGTLYVEIPLEVH